MVEYPGIRSITLFKHIYLAAMSCLLLTACATDLSEPQNSSEETGANTKSGTLTLLADSPCSSPCTVSVTGGSSFWISEVQYHVDGVQVGSSNNWVQGYEFALPATLDGFVTVEARAMDIFGLVNDSATKVIGVWSTQGNGASSANSAQPARRSGTDTVQISTDGRCENPCVLSARVTGSATMVVFSAGPYPLGTGNADSGFSISYEFSQTGARSISAQAIDNSGRILAEDTKLIEIESRQPTNSVSSGSVPYFFQYNNQLYPGSSCQNTSIAMVLSYLGWNGVPDDITSRFGKDRAQSPGGLAEVFNSYASSNGLSMRLEPTTNGSIAGLKAALDRGHPVIIHGYFTSYGHVVVVLGYDANGYYVHDPAGAWSQVFKGGYSGGGSGNNVYYGKSAFETAVATDGYSQLPLWFHVLR